MTKDAYRNLGCTLNNTSTLMIVNSVSYTQLITCSEDQQDQLIECSN